MKNKKGLTLIEVILTIAIISIMAVTILGMFNTGIINIVKSGKRTDEVFEASKIIDEKIKINENITNGTDEVKITIPGVLTKTIKGIIIKSPDGKVETFVPNK